MICGIQFHNQSYRENKHKLSTIDKPNYTEICLIIVNDLKHITHNVCNV